MVQGKWISAAFFIGTGAGALGGLVSSFPRPVLFWRHMLAGASAGATADIVLIFKMGEVKGLGELAVIPALLSMGMAAGAVAGLVSTVLP